jgi:uncharacterized protein (DUF1501 family)
MRERNDTAAERVAAKLSRRRFLQGTLAGAAVVAAGRLGLPAFAAGAAKAAAKARAVIQIWMWGGPSHLDTFDPKPDAGSDHTGPFDKPIATNVAGIRINELLPLLAKQADKYSIIRSLTHGINGHETASYTVQTGRPPGGRLSFPCAGAVVSLFKGRGAGYRGEIPPYVVLTQPQGRFSEAGFLGLKHMPFATGGDPAAARFAVEGIVLKDVSDERQRRRRDLLNALDIFRAAAAETPAMAAAERAREDAYATILGDGGKVFDLSQEQDSVRERYGRNTFGQSCLVARRLVEKGVPYVTVNYPGWDTHKQHFQAMRRLLPQLDAGFSALLEDLAARGLLDSTIVWWGGEFGRTPRVQWEPPWNGGRNHYGNVFSHVLAGGGFKGGRVVGASTARGEEVKERPVYPCDLLGSLYAQLGIDPDGPMANPLGLDVRVTPDAAENVKSGGRLREIM